MLDGVGFTGTGRTSQEDIVALGDGLVRFQLFVVHVGVGLVEGLLQGLL